MQECDPDTKVAFDPPVEGEYINYAERGVGNCRESHKNQAQHTVLYLRHALLLFSHASLPGIL